MGIIRPFGSAEIEFTFKPSLPGRFEETLEIINVMEPRNTLVVTIKCKVVKPEHFALPNARLLDFGRCFATIRSRTLRIPVQNTSRRRRRFAVRSEPGSFSLAPHWLPQFTFDFIVCSSDNGGGDGVGQMSTERKQKLEEELERLEHKLRIATTKKKTEKVAKITAKIAKLEAQLSGPRDTDVNVSLPAFEPTRGPRFAYDSSISSESESESEGGTR